MEKRTGKNICFLAFVFFCNILLLRPMGLGRLGGCAPSVVVLVVASFFSPLLSPRPSLVLVLFGAWGATIRGPGLFPISSSLMRARATSDTTKVAHPLGAEEKGSVSVAARPYGGSSLVLFFPHERPRPSGVALARCVCARPDQKGDRQKSDQAPLGTRARTDDGVNKKKGKTADDQPTGVKRTGGTDFSFPK
nr:hypothetical protein [Pandoravirus belohorizontensis]